MKSFKRVPLEKCELEGPYECPGCEGHLMVDATYLDQVIPFIKCPYCHGSFEVPEAGDTE